MLLEIKENGVVLQNAELIEIGNDGPIVSADLAKRLHLRLTPEQRNEATITLQSLPGMHWQIDQQLQQLVLTPDPQALDSTEIGFDAQRPADIPNTRGFWLNYDGAASAASGTPVASALMQLGGFTEFGTVQSEGVFSSNGRSTRLGTAFLRPSPSGESAIRIGDGFLTGGALGQSFPFGGIQISSREWFDRQQRRSSVQTILGEAATPSTLDVFVNDALQSRQSVPAGPFTLSNLPTVTGDGTVHIVVRDALGQERIIDRSFYSSPMILREGTYDWSMEAGMLRRNYGSKSFSYGEPFSAGTSRQGVLPWLSVEEHVELSGRRQQGGAQASIQIGNIGAMRLGAAASRDRNGFGSLATAGIESNHGIFTFGASAEIAGGQYTQLGYDGRRQLRQSGEVRASVDLGIFGALNVSLVRSAIVGQNPSNVAAASWTHRLGDLGQLSASGYGQLNGKNAGILLSLVVPLGPGRTASADALKDSDGLHLRTQATEAAPAEGGFGARALVETGRNAREEAGTTWRWSGGEATVDAGRFRGNAVGRATVSGGLTWVDGGLYAAQRSEGGFAVADVGAEGVRVYADKQPIGTTGRDGKVLIPRLRPYENNQISIDPGDLPMDLAIGATETAIVPRERAGYVVKFETRRAAFSSLILVHPDGSPISAGSRAVILRSGEVALVGYDGVFYAPGLQPGDIVEVEDGGQKCRASARTATGAAPEKIPCS